MSRTEGRGAADDLLVQARRDYERCRDAWQRNQEQAREDLRFARLGEQWPADMAEQRKRENRPCLTFNKMPAFIRQVVNDARQNKPSIKVHPQDSGADKRVAEIYDGLIRNIETASDADVATDTAIEHAVGQGFGFWRYNLVYARDDAFEKDIVVERVANPFTIYGDPRSKSETESKGPGDRDGIGTGQGPGIGEGNGPGVGPGEKGNMGGGDRQFGCCGPAGGSDRSGNDQPFAGSQVEQRARVLFKPEPTYTEDARKNQITGTVMLRVVFASNGDVVQIRAVHSLPYGLTERAIAAARQIKFVPAVKAGHPVSVFMQLEYNFNLY